MKKSARVGAAAFALGLFLAGPQAAGVAAADSQDDSAAGPVRARGAGLASSEAQASRGATRSTPAPAARSTRAVAPEPARRSRARSGDSRLALQSARTAVSVASVPLADVPAPVPATAGVPVAAGVVGSMARQARTASVGATPIPLRRLGTPAQFKPPAMIAAQAEINTAVSRLFNQASNWLAELPANDVTAWIDGALQMIRKSFFNQAPRISPVQEVTTTGLIIGSLGVLDPEADPFTTALVDSPTHGTVELTAEGEYLYTPGSDYAGSDSFTVNVAPTNRVFNLLDPFGNGSREVTVEVGSRGNADPFQSDTESEPQDPIDTAVYLPNASAHITVERRLFGQFAGTVSLDGITPEIEVTWMDAKGRFGLVSVADLASEYWDEFATAARDAGGGVTVCVAYQDVDGTRSTVLLTNVEASQNSVGQYEFSGTLAPNPKAGARIDQWDVIGTSFQAPYENFLSTYIEIADFQTVDLDVTGADFFAMTYSPSSYADAIAGTDPGVSLEEAARVPGIATLTAAAKPTAGIAVSAAPSAPVGRAYLSGWSGDAVTVMMPYSGREGDALIIGDGEGRVRFGGLIPGWNTLKGTGWSASVNTVLPYGDGFVVGLGSGAVEQWTGKAWRELQGVGWAHPVASMMPYGEGFVVGLGNGSIQQWTGTGWTELKDAGWAAAANTLTAYGDGFVVGLGSGAVEQWTGSAWRELQGVGWAHPVTATMPYGEGFVVGLGNGSIQQWTGTRFTELQDARWGGAATTLVPVEGGFVVGLATGGVQRWTPAGWEELSPSRISLTEDILRQAVVYAQSGGEALEASDPLFGQLQLKPACADTNSCDGSFYPFQFPGAINSLASTTFDFGATGGQSLELSYDAGLISYGYIYVPGGVFDKIRPSQYAAGALVAIPTGPSLTLDMAGENGTFTWAGNLIEASYSLPPSVYGSFEIAGKVDASLAVTLGLPDGFTKDSLAAHAYYVPGLLVALNTGGDYGVRTGVSAYADIDANDFLSLTGVAIKPTLTPSVTASWGLFTPKNTPIVDRLSLFELSLGYKNPVSLELALSKTGPASLTLESSGSLTYGAAVLPKVTEALTFNDEYQIYDVKTGNLLA